MRRFVLVICLLAAIGCLGKSPVAPAPVNREVVLAPGQTAAVASDLSVKFVTVVGDNRCPLNALCIQGGNATVRIDVEAGEARGERELQTATQLPIAFEDVQLTLLDLQPYPFSPSITDPNEYRATIRIVR